MTEPKGREAAWTLTLILEVDAECGAVPTRMPNPLRLVPDDRPASTGVWIRAGHP